MLSLQVLSLELAAFSSSLQQLMPAARCHISDPILLYVGSHNTMLLLLLYYNAYMYYIMHTCINDMLLCIRVLYYHIVLYYTVIITHPRDAE